MFADTKTLVTTATASWTTTTATITATTTTTTGNHSGPMSNVSCMLVSFYYTTIHHWFPRSSPKPLSIAWRWYRHPWRWIHATYVKTHQDILYKSRGMIHQERSWAQRKVSGLTAMRCGQPPRWRNCQASVKMYGNLDVFLFIIISLWLMRHIMLECCIC